MTVGHITCASCQERIREHEPDICLKRQSPGEKYFYHVGCKREPEMIVSTEGRGVWSLVYRRLLWDDTEGGAA